MQDLITKRSSFIRSIVGKMPPHRPKRPAERLSGLIVAWIPFPHASEGALDAVLSEFTGLHAGLTLSRLVPLRLPLNE